MLDDNVGPQAVKSRCRKPFKTIDLISATTKKSPRNKITNKKKWKENQSQFTDLIYTQNSNKLLQR